MTVTGAGSRPRGSGWRVAAAALALLALAGCSVLPGPAVDGPDARPADAPGGAADEIIAAELSNVFANAFDPMTTTVQVPVRDDDAARAALVAALAGRGFGIQRVAADQGAHFLETERVVEAAEDRATRVLWRASIGPAEVRRDYTIAADGALYAASPIRLAGTRTDIRTADLERAEPMSVDPAYRRIEYVAPRTPADPRAGDLPRHPRTRRTCRPRGGAGRDLPLAGTDAAGAERRSRGDRQPLLRRREQLRLHARRARSGGPPDRRLRQRFPEPRPREPRDDPTLRRGIGRARRPDQPRRLQQTARPPPRSATRASRSGARSASPRSSPRSASRARTSTTRGAGHRSPPVTASRDGAS